MAKPSVYVCVPAFAPVGPIDAEKMLARVRSFADRYDLRVETSPLMSQYLGKGAWHDVDARLTELRTALGHDYVVPFRGGFGGLQLATELMTMPCEAQPTLIGYSDNTVLHACWRKRGLGPSFYGELPGSEHGRMHRSLDAAMRGQPFAIDSPTERGVRLLRSGRASGPCYAACLTVLATTVGTPCCPDLRGCILLIEDVDEKPYQIDAAMTQLHLAGVFDGVAGLVGGAFAAQLDRNYEGPSADDILRRWGEQLDVPTLSRLPFGHTDDAYGLPIGREAVLEASDDGAWELRVNT